MRSTLHHCMHAPWPVRCRCSTSLSISGLATTWLAVISNPSSGHLSCVAIQVCRHSARLSRPRRVLQTHRRSSSVPDSTSPRSPLPPAPCRCHTSDARCPCCTAASPNSRRWIARMPQRRSTKHAARSHQVRSIVRSRGEDETIIMLMQAYFRRSAQIARADNAMRRTLI